MRTGDSALSSLGEKPRAILESLTRSRRAPTLLSIETTDPAVRLSGKKLLNGVGDAVEQAGDDRDAAGV
jgi:hypothetical protein